LFIYSAPYVKGTSKNRSIILNNGKVKGWEKMSCSINGLASDNILTVPYMEDFKFDHNQNPYRINHMYTISCMGKMYPPGKVTYSFRVEKYEIANLTEGKLSVGDYPNIDVMTNRHGDNYIMIVPTSDVVYGAYFCEMIFQADQKKAGYAVSNSWNVVPGPTQKPTTDSPNNLDKHFPLIPNRKYYSRAHPDLNLSCNGTAWHQFKRITFTSGKTVIFDSLFKANKCKFCLNF